MPKSKKKTIKIKAPKAGAIARKRELSDEEDIHEKMRKGVKDEEVYDTHALEELEENDEIATWEEGFMEGAHGGGESAKCRNCGKILIDEAIEEEVHGEACRFCSQHCAESYDEKHSSHEEEE